MSHDILSDVLRTVRLRGALFFHVSGNRSWAAEAPPARDIASIVMPECEHVPRRLRGLVTIHESGE